MKMPKTLTIAAMLCLGSAATAAAQHDELKQRVLAQAQSLSPDDYAFTRTVRSETTSNGKTEKKVSVEKFDPTKPADARWTLVSVNGAPPSAEESEAHQKEAAKRRIVPGYHRVAAYFGAPATASESGGKTVFRFASRSPISRENFSRKGPKPQRAETSMCSSFQTAKPKSLRLCVFA